MPHAGLCVYELGSNLRVHTKPEKLRLSRDTSDISIQLLKVNDWMNERKKERMSEWSTGDWRWQENQLFGEKPAPLAAQIPKELAWDQMQAFTLAY